MIYQGQLGANEDSEIEGNEDVFNNEAMENPSDDELNVNHEEDAPVQSKMPAERRTPSPSVQKDGAARFIMPAERRTPGPSVQEEEEAARFQMPAQNPDHRNRVANESTNHIHNEELWKDTITVRCHKLNGKPFNGTVNFSEAKTKVFQNGLGLDANLLSTVHVSYNHAQLQYQV